MWWKRRPLDVSVVVPTGRQPARLARCVAALRAQTLDLDCFEVLVVDESPDGRMREVVRELSAGGRLPRLRYLRAPSGQGRTWARRFGWRSAQAPVVAFADRAAPLRSDWLRQGLSQLMLQPGCAMSDSLIWRSALEPAGEAGAGWLPGRTAPRRRFFEVPPRVPGAAVAERTAPRWDDSAIVALTLAAPMLAFTGWPWAAALAAAGAALLVVWAAWRRPVATAGGLAGVGGALQRPFRTVFGWLLGGRAVRPPGG